MKNVIAVCRIAAMVLLLTPISVQAQNNDPLAYNYVTYMYCDNNRAGEKRMDEAVAEVDQGIFNKAMEDGVIQGWGWLAHQTGGLWRRALYFQAESVEGLWSAQEILAEMSEASDSETTAQRFEICHSHEDYVWALQLASSGEGRSGTGFSVYYECDVAGESRADEIMKNDFAPVFDKYVEQGKLASWGWSSHVIGGKFRRLQTMTADSRAALLKARSEILNELFRSGVDTGPEFSSICGSHVDYMWDIQLEFQN